MKMKKPIFTYWADGSDAFTHKEGICDCCKQQVSEYHISYSKWWAGWKVYSEKQMYSPEDVDKRGEYELHLCYDCITSGTAAQQFQLKFNWVVDPSDECAAIGHEEVERRTPAYVQGAKETWPVHCGEACVYLEGYGTDIDRYCHEFQCRRCGAMCSVDECRE